MTLEPLTSSGSKSLGELGEKWTCEIAVNVSMDASSGSLLHGSTYTTDVSVVNGSLPNEPVMVTNVFSEPINSRTDPVVAELNSGEYNENIRIPYNNGQLYINFSDSQNTDSVRQWDLSLSGRASSYIGEYNIDNNLSYSDPDPNGNSYGSISIRNIRGGSALLYPGFSITASVREILSGSYARWKNDYSNRVIIAFNARLVGLKIK